MPIRFEKLIGPESAFPLEHRILNTLLLLGIGLAVLSSVINYLINMEIVIVYFSIFTSLTLLCAYSLSIIKKNYKTILSVMTFMCIFVFTPIMWIYNAGLQGGATFDIILFSSIISLILQGSSRVIALVCLLVVVTILTALDYHYPGLIVPYHNALSKYVDIYSNLIIILITNAMGFAWFLHLYKKEQVKVRDCLILIEQQKMATALSRLERLNLIGEMAASIGHEVRNPLTTVRGYLQLFQRRSTFTEHTGQLNTMIEEIDRANAIISEFLSLAKNKKTDLENSDLNKSIVDLLPLIEANALHTGHLIVADLGNIPNLRLDRKELRQLILNLIKNGLEATPPGGTITIKTCLAVKHVVLSIQDTGHGIPQEILQKLGTPFLTTKETGTGLGIPVCYRIAERHDAQIHIESYSKGTTFHILFPASETS